MKAMAPVDQMVKAGGGSGKAITQHNTINIEARTDSAQIATLVQSAMRSAQAELLDMMDRGQA